MVDEGLVVGSAALGIALLSLSYARAQAVSAHRQADETRRQAEIAAGEAKVEQNLAMYERLRQVRRSFVETPRLYAEFTRSNPDLARAYEDAGGAAVYYTVREAMDMFQNIYFLRREGVLSDHYWKIWGGAIFRNYAKLPTFQSVYRFAAESGYLHPDFVLFYDAVVEGRPAEDPRPT